MNIESMSGQKSTNKDTLVDCTKRTSKGRFTLIQLGFAVLAVVALLFFCTINAGRCIAKTEQQQEVLYQFAYQDSLANGIQLVEKAESDTTIKRLKQQGEEKRLKEYMDSIIIKPVPAVSRLAYGLFALLILSIGAMFIPAKAKQIYLLGGSVAIAACLALLSPVAVSFAFVVFLLIAATSLYIIANAILFVIQQVEIYRHKPWYQKNNTRYTCENAAMRKFEPKAEQSFEEGYLVYTVVTDRHITRQENPLAYQMVFAEDYLKTGNIMIYLIMPELDELFTPANGLTSSRIKTDVHGEKYLNFTLNVGLHQYGVDVLREFYQWIDSYNHHRAGDVLPQDIKL